MPAPKRGTLLFMVTDSEKYGLATHIRHLKLCQSVQVPAYALYEVSLKFINFNELGCTEQSL